MLSRHKTQPSRNVVDFRGGGWQRTGHHGNLGRFFQDLGGRPSVARTNGALSVEDVLAASGGMQGLRGVLSSVVQDALRSHSRRR